METRGGEGGEEEEEDGLHQRLLPGGGGGGGGATHSSGNPEHLSKRRVPAIAVRRQLPFQPKTKAPVLTQAAAHTQSEAAAQKQRAQALSAVTAPLLDAGRRQYTRSNSAPRERRTVKLPENDLLREQRRRTSVSVQHDHEHVIDIRNDAHDEDHHDDELGTSAAIGSNHQSPMKTFESSSGRIMVYCIAEKFSKLDLIKRIIESKAKLCDGIAIEPGEKLEWEGDVLQFPCCSLWTGSHIGDIFFFHFGVVVFWGFEDIQESIILESIVNSCSIDPLPPSEIEDEEFRFQYTEGERPRIQNDTIIMGVHLSQNSIIKLGIVYPLAQSTKLKKYESRIQSRVNRYIELPRTLATTGTVELSKKEIHMLIGTIFLEKCAVNLLTTVLDTPDFFWDASDALCVLYDAIFEYLEISDRVEILNARFEILEAMLDMLRDHQQNEHSSFLEWIVIILIVIEVIIGLVEIFGLTGLLPHTKAGI